MKPSPHHHVIARGDLTQRSVGAKCFVVTPAGRMVILDNETGRFLWGHIVAAAEGGCSVHGLVEALVGAFQVERQQAEADVTSFVRTLEDETLVAITERAGGGS